MPRGVITLGFHAKILGSGNLSLWLKVQSELTRNRLVDSSEASWPMIFRRVCQKVLVKMSKDQISNFDYINMAEISPG